MRPYQRALHHLIRNTVCLRACYSMAGVSRSATVVTSYIMWKRAWTLYDSYEVLQNVRPKAKPGQEFWNQLELFARLKRNHTHANLHRITPRWPWKPLLTRWYRPVGGRHDVAYEYIEHDAYRLVDWQTSVRHVAWHYFLYLYNTYLRYSIRIANAEQDKLLSELGFNTE
jgi:hypothetical protein